MTLARLSLTEEAARALTDEVKRDAEALWAKLLDLYEGKAHEALGYTSWGDYYTAEFGGSRSAAYRLLEAGRVALAIVSPNVGTDQLPAPPTVHHAQALAPFLRQHGEEAVREAWAEITAAAFEATTDADLAAHDRVQEENILRAQAARDDAQKKRRFLARFRTTPETTTIEALANAARMEKGAA